MKKLLLPTLLLMTACIKEDVRPDYSPKVYCYVCTSHIDSLFDNGKTGRDTIVRTICDTEAFIVAYLDHFHKATGRNHVIAGKDTLLFTYKISTNCLRR
ncbi:hypothetical protein [Chitinophaga agri]|uniref:Uncharacterized protein n=1 Tax=Chitinophaga agri TaxID=2703787 RepID=A0A6B9ZIP6_9BACT|nr:hypothetical protein [Chitinophaga agri]QHS61659.1 hypothetical protein GWR21_19265 [Chitinophaga agri]